METEKPRYVPRMQRQLESHQVARTILEEVAHRHWTTRAQLCEGRGPAGKSLVKFEAVWLMRQAGLSWPIIGKAMGYGHHSQAMYAWKRWKQIQGGEAR